MYKSYLNSQGKECLIRINDDGSITTFLADLNSSDYVVYLAWLAEGNTPLPPDEV